MDQFKVILPYKSSSRSEWTTGDLVLGREGEREGERKVEERMPVLFSNSLQVVCPSAATNPISYHYKYFGVFLVRNRGRGWGWVVGHY